jgi:hypothetical protein
MATRSESVFVGLFLDAVSAGAPGATPGNYVRVSVPRTATVRDCLLLAVQRRLRPDGDAALFCATLTAADFASAPLADTALVTALANPSERRGQQVADLHVRPRALVAARHELLFGRGSSSAWLQQAALLCAASQHRSVDVVPPEALASAGRLNATALRTAVLFGNVPLVVALAANSDSLQSLRDEAVLQSCRNLQRSVLALQHCRLGSLRTLAALSPPQPLAHIVALSLAHNSQLRALPDAVLLIALPMLESLDLRDTSLALPPLRLITCATKLREVLWTAGSVPVPFEAPGSARLDLAATRYATTVSTDNCPLFFWWQSTSTVSVAACDEASGELLAATLTRFVPVVLDSVGLSCVGRFEHPSRAAHVDTLWTATSDSAGLRLEPLLLSTAVDALGGDAERRVLVSGPETTSVPAAVVFAAFDVVCGGGARGVGPHTDADLGIPDQATAAVLEALGLLTRWQESRSAPQWLLLWCAPAREAAWSRAPLIRERSAVTADLCAFRNWTLCSGTRLRLHKVALLRSKMQQTSATAQRLLQLKPAWFQAQVASDAILLTDAQNSTRVEVILSRRSTVCVVVLAAGLFHEARLSLVCSALNLGALVATSEPLCRSSVAACVFSLSITHDRIEAIGATDALAATDPLRLFRPDRSDDRRPSTGTLKRAGKLTSGAQPFARIVSWSADDTEDAARWALRAVCVRVLRGNDLALTDVSTNSFAFVPASDTACTDGWKVGFSASGASATIRLSTRSADAARCRVLADLEIMLVDELERVMALPRTVAEASPRCELTRMIEIGGVAVAFGDALMTFMDRRVGTAADGPLSGVERTVALPELSTMRAVACDFRLDDGANDSGASARVRFTEDFAVKRVWSNPGFEQKWWKEARVSASAADARAVALSRSPLLSKASLGVDQLYFLSAKQRCNVHEALLRGDALAKNHAVELIRSIAGALLALHGVGLVHGDVKLRNVLIKGDGEFLMCDFGDVEFLDTLASVPWLLFENDWVSLGGIAADALLVRAVADADERAFLLDVGALMTPAALKKRFLSQTLAQQMRPRCALADTPLDGAEPAASAMPAEEPAPIIVPIAPLAAAAAAAPAPAAVADDFEPRQDLSLATIMQRIDVLEQNQRTILELLRTIAAAASKS